MKFRLPRLPRALQITDKGGTPTTKFQLWWQQFAQQIEAQEQLQDGTITTLQTVQLEILALQDSLQDQVDALQAVNDATVAAQNAAAAADAAAAAAQTKADEADAAVVAANATLAQQDAILQQYGIRLSDLEGQP